MALSNLTVIVEREGKSYAVRRSQMLGGGREFYYDVFEPTQLCAHGGKGHSTITSNIDIGDTVHTGFWGQVGARDLPAEVDALPVGEARFAACAKHRADQALEAHKLIMHVFPEAKNGRPDGAEIRLVEVA